MQLIPRRFLWLKKFCKDFDKGIWESFWKKHSFFVCVYIHSPNKVQ